MAKGIVKGGLNDIGGGEGGLDTSDATAVASDLAYGKTAYAVGAKITGTDKGEPKIKAWEASEVTSNTTLLDTISCAVGDLVLAVVVTRSAVTHPTGWTVLETGLECSDGGVIQWLHVYAKVIDSGNSITLSVTQASADRIYMNLIDLQDVALPVHKSAYDAESVSSTTFSLAKPSNKPMLLCIHSALWSTVSPFPVLVYSGGVDYILMSLGTSVQSILTVILDRAEQNKVYSFVHPTNSLISFCLLEFE